MHFFYSFLKKSIELYNEDNTKESNKFFMINAISLSHAHLQKPIDHIFFKLVNPLWQKCLSLKSAGQESIRYGMALNVLLNANHGNTFTSLSQLSRFQRVTLESEMQDRKATWDTFGVEVD